jgi:sugar lactone lactonase YvrE
MAVDRHGNGFYTSPQGDKVYVVDAETGKTSEVAFPPQGTADCMAVTEKDRQAYVRTTLTPFKSVRAGWAQTRARILFGSRYFV